MPDLSSLLLELETLLRDGDAVLSRYFASAASPSEVEASLEQIGVQAPPELVAWFGWHNGVEADLTGQPLKFGELVPGAEFYDVSRLTQEYRQARAVAQELAGHPQVLWSADEIWPPTWLPLLRLFGKGFVVVDARLGPTSPVRVVWHDDDHDDRLRVVWQSLELFVKFIVEQFRTGVYFVGVDGAVAGPTLDRPGR